MAHIPKQLYGFGSFTLDPHERVLLREGRSVQLPPKDFDMLLVLVENHGRVLEKEELMKRVWPDSFVEEANLSHHVFMLRKALGDDKGEARYIQTIPRRGYRFVAPVTGLPDQDADSVSVGSVSANGAAGCTSSDGTAVEQPARPPTDAEPRRRLSHKAMPAAAVAIVALAAGYGGWTLKPAPSPGITRLVIPLTSGDTFTTGTFAALALSPDGTRLAYTANDRLYLRPLDQLDARPIPGVESPGLASARGPFFSPDGRWIGFWEGRQIKKVSTSGGAPLTVCELTPPPYSASWAADDTILIGHGARGIWRVPANGGTAERIITVADGQRAHGPQLLPDGRSVLFTLAQRPSWDEADIVVQSLDSGVRTILIPGGTDARYLPTGHLVYALRGTLLAVPFDAVSLRIKGAPQPLVANVLRRGGAFASAAQFTVSSNGTLAYVESSSLPAARRTLVWVDRGGHEDAIPAEPKPYVYPRLSPDGTRLALDIQDENRDIWVWEFSRGTLTRVTSDPTPDMDPVWTPNGERLIFLSLRTGMGNLFWQPANGTGTAERLTDGNQIRGADTMSPDGNGLVLRESDGKGTVDLTLLDLRTRRPGQLASSGTKPLVQSAFLESNAEISPDGRWLAYQSNHSGALNVYVRPFPETGAGQWPVSTAGGTEPLWARNGQELFYRSLTGAVMRVSLEPRSTWTASAPSKLIDGPSYALAGIGDFADRFRRTYDVSPDGRRFLMIKNTDPAATIRRSERIVVVQNWHEELKRLRPSR